jgi:predicted CXXCH cytochrome family protein
MKRNTVLVGIGLTAAGCFAVAAMADIVGTAHDFSTQGWSDGEICKPCHTPHNAIALPGGHAQAPLWNHDLTVATYTLFDGTSGDVSDLDDRSVLCMSCHDGTVALDSFGGSTGVVFIGTDGLLGTDLSDDHPIGSQAVYPDVPWMNDPVNWENNPHGFELRDMIVDGQPERVVSCTTCHEPHNRARQEHMLWINNNASALCLTCHIK